MGNKLPPVATMDPSQCYPSQDLAALGVLRSLPPKIRETAFAIYKTQGPDAAVLYCASVGIPGTGDNFAFRSEKGRDLAALAHTHPQGHDSHKFSDPDVTMADTLKRPSYIRDDATGAVRRYDPGVTKTDATSRPGSPSQRRRTATGTLVGTTRREQLEAAYEHAKQNPNPLYEK